ncbi:hypothetical protein WCX49_11925 [Sulfurimonas sp. HSL-1656]|uniref:hypothetical protein n=1 Tax=Thiomicrolovo subterrani TaxID=3131934 RepID=UPI0031F9D696
MKPQSYKDYIPKGARVLHLVVTQHWFDEIAAGRKLEDFRVIKDCWFTRMMRKNESSTYKKEVIIASLRRDCTTTSLPIEGFELLGIEYREFDYVVLSVGYKTVRPQIISKWGGTRITGAYEQTDLGVGRFFAVDVSDVLHVLNYGGER